MSVTVGEPNRWSGTVKGSVTAFDPNGNPVTFAVGLPGKGKVTLNRAGEFVYTPTVLARHAASASNAGPAAKTDSFTVTVSNGTGGTTVVSVTVAIAPKNAAPSASKSVGRPNADTGVVGGKITGRDPDKDALTYSTSVAPAKGSVVFNSDGTFTYTPTQAARHAAGKPGVKSADKSDKFTVMVSDGHGGTDTVTISVTIAPRKLTTSAEKLFAAMDPYTPDKLTAQLVTSGGKKRMVVYMTGIDGFFNNPDSAIVGLLGNTGWLNPIVSSFIDGAVTQWQPEEVMLVGFSNGGQQMQNYAGWAAGANTKLVKSLVLFGAPLTKKVDELQGASSLSIIDLRDPTAGNLTHLDAASSYVENRNDSREIYSALTAEQGDTHNQGTYIKVAKKLDEGAKNRGLLPKVLEIYKGWVKFAGAIIDEKVHKIT